MPVYSFNPFPAFETSRLKLRKLSVEDSYELLRIRSNKIVNEFIDRPETTSLEEAALFIEMINGKINNNESIYWAIELKETKKLIGTVCLYNLSIHPLSGELGYELHPDFHGQGLMHEAIQCVVNYGFNKINLKVITALPKKENIKSIHLLLKNKFIHDEGYRFVREEDAIGYRVYYLLAQSTF